MIPVDIQSRSAAGQLQRRMRMSEGELRKELAIARGNLARLRLLGDMDDLRTWSARATQAAQVTARAGVLTWAVAAAARAWQRRGQGKSAQAVGWIQALSLAGGLFLRLRGAAAAPTPATTPATTSTEAAAPDRTLTSPTSRR